MIEEPLFTMHGHTNIIAGLVVVWGSNRVITTDVDAVVKVGIGVYGMCVVKLLAWLFDTHVCMCMYVYACMYT